VIRAAGQWILYRTGLLTSRSNSAQPSSNLPKIECATYHSFQWASITFQVRLKNSTKTRIMNLSIKKKFFLFDLDGTLLDSTMVIERLWQEWADTQGIAIEDVLKVSHGRRAKDTMALFVGVRPDLDAMSDAFIAQEIITTDGITALPGAKAFLEQLPPDRWAIVTSCVSELAHARINAAGLPVPKIMVTADMVPRGKPHPDSFLLGAERIGALPNECIAFEDAESGVEAALAAGMTTILVHKQKRFNGVIATIPDYSLVSASLQDDDLHLKIGDG